MSLKDAIFKPYNSNKYLYRPFLVWNVRGKERTIIGEHIFNEAIGSLYANAIGWKKYPPEWGNDCFKEYVKKKSGANDKILEDKADDLLKKYEVIYDRNITSLKKWNNQNLNIHNEKCGEIDLLFLHNDRLFIGDSKHLISRYDMSNFRNDYNAFETSKKAYNKTMLRKIKFLNNNSHLIEEHFRVVRNDKNLAVEFSGIEGIFVVNTSTFLMYNNHFRIYTIKGFKELLTNTYKDMSYQLLVDEGDEQKLIKVDYPYFKKPTYFVFEPDDEN